MMDTTIIENLTEERKENMMDTAIASAIGTTISLAVVGGIKCIVRKIKTNRVIKDIKKTVNDVSEKNVEETKEEESK